MGISPESHEEQALQAHSIRQTTTCLFQLLPEALHVIPTTDNSSVRLPEEPFTALSRLYVLRELKRPYDEEAIECVGSDEISEDVLDSKTSMTPLPPTTSPTCVSLASEMGVLSFRRGLDGSNFTTLSPEEQNEVLSLRHWSHRTSEHLDSAEERPYENSMRTRKIDCGQHFWLARDQNEELDHEEREEEEREEREEAARQSELEASHTKAAVSANQFSPMQCN
ncbi:hypothetical protein EV361DRAFT_948399 [Lentinula raphanica]|nr:hypothetical protein F5880DRAFT_1609406 [Lentinula raphanica]KAJ3972904.1 hypothetical protein EV361DRAFT_948399 [Lentinula raphanica]